MLSNLETPQSKLLQIILVGQPELAELLERVDLRQLRQRVELRQEIRPLDGRETGEYVRERLLIAGHETGEIFTRSALRAVHEHANGIPRVINVLCDNVLLTAFAKQSVRASAAMVNESASDLGLVTSAATGAKAASTGGWFGRRWFSRPARPGLA